jgi:CIC family chloride channel protein
VHNLLFLGHWSFYYESSVFTPPSPWGPWVILVPVIGAVGVTFIVNNFAPEAKGHGVPEVMDAIYYNRGVIRPVLAVAKSLASALAIGSGAAVGRGGPIIQIGSALGSTFGQVIRMSMGQRIILVAVGAGAGIAATFNTPIGGMLFATELILPEISVNTFLPVAIATGTATFIGRLFFGAQPAFSVPSDLAPLPAEPSSALILLLYVGLGAVIGVAAAVFVRSLHWAEDGFDKVPGRYLRHMLGMLLVGALIYALMRWGGHYYVEGVGYATIQATLTANLPPAASRQQRGWHHHQGAYCRRGGEQRAHLSSLRRKGGSHTVPCPVLEWPRSLEEAAPPEDGTNTATPNEVDRCRYGQTFSHSLGRNPPGAVPAATSTMKSER